MGKTILLLLIVIPLTFAVGFRTGQGDPGAYRNSLQSSPQTTTDSLVVDLHSAWNAADVEALVRRLDPDAFFFSPYQLRYGRDEMACLHQEPGKAVENTDDDLSGSLRVMP